MPGRDARTLLARLKSARRLPSPPGAALRVLEICRKNGSGVKEIAEAIGPDPALSARLLKFANSSVTGLTRQVTSVREAVLLMGVRSVKLVALGFSLATPGRRSACVGFDLQQYWREACAAAVIARAIARTPYGAEPEEAFTAGLLARIGRLAIAEGIPDEYARVLATVDSGVPLLAAEAAGLGCDHVEFGAALLAEWGLPDLLVEAVRHQIHPDGVQGKAGTLARVIRAAHDLTPLFAGEAPRPDQVAAAKGVIDQELRLDEPVWRELAGKIRAAHEATADALDIRLGQHAALDLYEQARHEAEAVAVVPRLTREQALREARNLLRRATTDSLTGATNIARFEERLAELTRGLARGLGDFALVLFDVDYFQRLNEVRGRPAGDMLLSRIARAVANSLRDVDLLARVGGDAFAVLAPGTIRGGACMIAARTRQSVESLRAQFGGHTLSATVSLGVASSADFESPPAPEAMLAEARKQLALSKKAGRNTWSYRDRTANRAARAA